MMWIMDEIELYRASKRYKQALRSGNYKRALEINRQIYESEFNRYRVLVEIRRLSEEERRELVRGFLEGDALTPSQAGLLIRYEGHIRKIDLVVRRQQKRLESLTNMGLRLATHQENKSEEAK